MNGTREEEEGGARRSECAWNVWAPGHRLVEGTCPTSYDRTHWKGAEPHSGSSRRSRQDVSLERLHEGATGSPGQEWTHTPDP